MIDAIEGIIVMVSDRERALRFYTDKLGFAKKLDTEEAGFRWTVVGPENSDTVISLMDPLSMKKGMENGPENPEKRIGQPTGIWFFAKDIRRTHRELASRGVRITEPKKQTWGGILCTVYDQDGNGYGLVGDSGEGHG